VESHVFSTRSPQAFHKFYAPPEKSAREAVDVAEDELRFTTSCVSSVGFAQSEKLNATQIVNSLAMLGEYPLIRYYRPTNKPVGVGVAYNEHITRRLAEMVQTEMDEYCKNNPDFPVRILLF
jgi:syntaxin-binding protein 1